MKKTKLKNLVAIACPLLAWSQGFSLGGPLQVDYAQFEAYDTKDIVNLGTGDFVYPLALAEVPGPYGNYPLSMSYHAGVTPAQEASWVGLGWALNPGAINRFQRGAPDDQFHGGDLSYLYSYTQSSEWTFGLSYSSLNTNFNWTVGMNYNSKSGYGMNAGASYTWLVNAGVYPIPISVGVDVTSNSTRLSGGVGVIYAGVGKVGVGGSVLFEGGHYRSAEIGPFARIGNEDVSLNASVGVQHQVGKGFNSNSEAGISVGVTDHSEMTLSLNSSGGVYAGFAYRAETGNGFSVGTSSMNFSSSSGNSESDVSNASLIIPIIKGGIWMLKYNRSIAESWVRQATTENTYGYMYQAGPAIFSDRSSADQPVTGSAGGNQGGIPWHWNAKGKALDRQGSEIKGDLFPAYDLFQVQSNGVQGTFRSMALSKHKLYESAEKIDGNDQNAQLLFYLLHQDQATQKQHKDEFPADNVNPANQDAFSKYSYDYCLDKTTGAPNYQGGVSQQARLENLLGTGGYDCSRYAILKSRHLNEANRLLLKSDPDGDRKFTSRMVFRFLGSSGYFESEDPFRSRSGQPYKYGKDELSNDFFQRELDGWNNGFTGSRRIEPILEGHSSIGRLQGFKITNPDGTEYYFMQPVRSLMHASYATNREKGSPLFVDRHSPGANDNFLNVIGNGLQTFYHGFGNLKDERLGTLTEWGSDFGDFLAGAAGGVLDFFWSSPKFKDVCQANNPDNQYMFSYQMSTNPTATQWLLTEVRGADFVNLDLVDMTKNFGFQAKFSYEEPIHYKWRFPYAPPRTNNGELQNFLLPKTALTPGSCNSNMYHASFGLKELVYLKSIETSTHKASFILNDADHPRVDGKGWVQDWTGKSENEQATKKKTVMPIFVGVQFPADVVQTGNASPSSPHVHEDVFGQQKGISCWYERNVQYRVKAAFLNVQLTAAQKKVFTMATSPQTATVSGLVASSGAASYQAPISDASTIDGKGFYFIEPPADPSAGSKASAVLFKIRNNSNAFIDAKGEEIRFGATKFQLSEDAVLKGTYRSNFQSLETTDPNATCPDLGVPESLEQLVVEFRDGGTFHNPPARPLMIFNDFLEFNGPNDNRMRYLDKIQIVDKQTNAVLKQVRFTYNNNLQPKTLNSYQEIGGDLREGYPNPNDPNMNGLQGKLTLTGVRQEACLNSTCSAVSALPPFKFSYNGEDETSFRIGETQEQSIMATLVSQDEWGFWNRHATLSNQKAQQYSADVDGTAWNLNKVVDPLGGIMEVYYERDRYKGESYASDGMVVPITFRRCGEKGTLEPGQTFEDEDHLCIDLLPRRWNYLCNNKGLLEGEWIYDAQGNYDYLPTVNISQGKQAFFQLNAEDDFRVGCALGLGGWRLGACKRHRQVGVLGGGAIRQVLNSSSVDVPLEAFEGQIDPQGLPARTLEMDVLYSTVKAGFERAGNKLTRHKIKGVNPIQGILWIREPEQVLAGGDIRVKKLVFRDMDLLQTTRFSYEPGDMAQYPDSVISTAFAERFAPVKSIEVLPNTFLPPISRVPGISDDEMIFLPGSKITYPKVTAVNVVESNSGEVVEILNGKTEYEFSTTQQGIASQATSINPVLRVKLSSAIEGAAKTINSLSLRFLTATNSEVGGIPQNVAMLKFSAPNDKSWIYENLAAPISINQVRKIELQLSYTQGGVVNVRQRVIDLGKNLQRHSDVGIGIVLANDDQVANLTAFRTSLSTPIVVRTTPANTAGIENGLAEYQDFSALTGLPLRTTYFRHMAPGVDQCSGELATCLADPAYKLIKSTETHYASQPTSADNRFLANAAAAKIGKTIETWEYTRKRGCGENCKDNDAFDDFASMELAVDKQMKHVVANAFVTKVVTKSGYNNSTGEQDFLVQEMSNHKIDPVTGSPSLVVNHAGPAGQSPAQVSMTTPAYSVDHVLARKMLSKNMLTPVYRTDGFTFTSTPTSGGTPINFDNVTPASTTGPLADHLAVTGINKFSDAVYAVTSGNSPILSQGGFVARFDLRSHEGRSNLVDDPGIFGAVVNLDFLTNWKGAGVSRTNGFYKPLETFDALAIFSARHYDPRGFHEIGGVANAEYFKSATLTPEGYFGPLIVAGLSEDKWSFEGASPSGDGDFLVLDGAFKISRRLDLDPFQKYRVEFQVYSAGERIVKAEFFTTSQSGAFQSVTLKRGLHTYMLELDAGASYGGNTPAPGSNGVRISEPGSATAPLKFKYLRVYPSVAQAATMIYNKRGDLVQSVGLNNASTYYEYDSFGKLTAIRNDDGIILSAGNKLYGNK